MREIVRTASDIGVGALTAYAFSTENWKRPRLEVDTLMRLLREYLGKELETLVRNRIRFRAMGRREELSPGVRRDIERAEQETVHHDGMILTVALNYSGRSEIVDACRRIASEIVAAGGDPSRISEADIERNLYEPELPDPDLLIRTSGEMRVSNFMLWQIAYTEIHVTETLWPDFRRAHLFEAIVEYQKRERRYGGAIDRVSETETPLTTAGGRQGGR